jgi:excisionase family DNA binding protein
MQVAAKASVDLKAPQCLGREQVAARLSVSQRTADALIWSGRIKSLRIGKKRLVTESALAAFIREQQQQANR